MTSRLKIAAAVAALASLAACGGDGGGDANAASTGTTAAAADTVPQSALQTPSALVAYVKSLVAAPSDTAQPVGLGGATLPMDDTGTPAAL